MNLTELLHTPPFMAAHRVLTRLVLSRADYIVTFAHTTQREAHEHFPQKKVVQIAGLPFNAQKAQQLVAKEVARKGLQIPAKTKVILFFGFVRTYKGLHDLLAAMPRVIEENPDALLIVAGEFWKDKSTYEMQIKELGIAARMRVMDKYIPEPEMAQLFSAADVVVLPYHHISQSGVIPLAFAFGVPVIATRVGGNLDWIVDGKNGLLVPVRDSAALARAINQFFSQGLASAFKKGIASKIREMEWNAEKEKSVLQN